MTDSLVPLLLTLLLALVTATSMLVLSWLLGRPKRSVVDKSPYECGIAPLDQLERHRFSVKFYLVAMLFILFDIEAAFLIPWAVTLQSFAADKLFVLVEMAVFLGVLVVGLAYIWRRGALSWE
jgi:NADH-quinone oxidoreductase subunit A